MSPAEFKEHMVNELAHTKAPCIGKMNKGHMRFFILPEEQHYWSPELNISFEEHEKGTLVRGLYGPKPNVWALFFYGYAVLGILALFATMWGMALLTMNKNAWPLWIVLGLAISAGILYMVAQTGQKLGAEQTFTLHHFFEDATDQRTHIDQ